MRKDGKNTLNSDKIECVKLAQREGSIKAMEKFKISPGTMDTWQKQHAAGLYKGREHLSTIGYYRGARAAVPPHVQGSQLPQAAVPIMNTYEIEMEALKRENANLKAALRKLLNIEAL